MSVNDNVQLTAWCPSSDLAQSLGSDGTDGDGKYVWSDCVAAGLNDGNGNKISMTEVIQLLIQLKNSQG